jgi:hypothetical protein
MLLSLDLSPRRRKRRPVAGTIPKPLVARRRLLWTIAIVTWIAASGIALNLGGMRPFYAVHTIGIACFALERFRRWLLVRRRGAKATFGILEASSYAPLLLAECGAAAIAAGTGAMNFVTGTRPLWWRVAELGAGLWVAIAMHRWVKAMDRGARDHFGAMASLDPDDPIAAARRSASLMRDPSSWISAPPPGMEDIIWQRERLARRRARTLA